MAADFKTVVRDRLDAANVVVADEARAALCGYLSVLARWNRRVNLTAFNLDAPSAHAIDRLIVEPVVAARVVHPDDRVAVDIGSGGGSPALPLKIAAPWLEMTLIEARVRKSAFLREVVRELGLAGVGVETMRLGAEGYLRLNGTVDVVTLRAVRSDERLWRGMAALARTGGRVFWFSDGAPGGGQPPGLATWTVEPNLPAEVSFLRVFSKT